MQKTFTDLYRRTHAGLKDGSAKNPLTVTVTSENQGGFHSRIAMRDHTIVSDQPHGFEGTNQGPKPSELLLAALAACQEVTWRLYAGAMEILVIHDDGTDAIHTASAYVPLPSALPFFGTGLGILGFIGWRRRRKAVATV